MDDLNELCKKLTVLLIQNDCETLKTLSLTIKEPIFVLGFMPYVALFCKAFQEYTDVELINSDVSADISSIRNSIKMFEDRYGKIKKSILNIDKEQDEAFKNDLLFDFLKRYNLYDNLGIYFTANKKIILNTHQCAYFLNLDLNDPKSNEKMYQRGIQLGSIVGSVSDGLSKILSPPHICIRQEIDDFWYLDVNTNENEFFNEEFDKETNLMFLHLLSMLNYVQYVLEPLFIERNTWLMRTKYVSVYYCYKGLSKLLNHLQQENKNLLLIENIKTVLVKGENLFSSVFRNCMMHFDLMNKGVFSIKEEYCAFNKPLFGLVESCFNGLTFDEYYEELTKYGKDIDELISSFFDIENADISKL